MNTKKPKFTDTAPDENPPAVAFLNMVWEALAWFYLMWRKQNGFEHKFLMYKKLWDLLLDLTSLSSPLHPQGFSAKWAFFAHTAFPMSQLNTELQVLYPHFRTGYTNPCAVAWLTLEHDTGFVWLRYSLDKPCDSSALQDTLRTFAEKFPLRVIFWALSHPIPAKKNQAT